jgi:cellulose synthase (UDP-forming)
MNYNSREIFLQNTQASKLLLIGVALISVIYFIFITFFITPSNYWLYGILIVGEIFHLWQIITYIITVWNTQSNNIYDKKFSPEVDVFITVAGEPIEIIKETAIAAKNMVYPKFNIYLLNDGYVAKKDNWQEVRKLAKDLGVNCITRRIPHGAKAGNINNALQKTKSKFFVVFDADHVPVKDFLKKTMGYFIDTKLGFVQTPQYYKNHSQNLVTEGSWRQQELFFGAICKGKNTTNSVFMCGTNMVLRREAIMEAGGMCETNIAEDFLTSLFVHSKGWKSIYVPEVLAEGLAPEDFMSYYKQQFRWARGSLEVIFKYNPLFNKGLSLAQKLQYLASASYYLSGIIFLLNMIVPLIFLFTGSVPLVNSSMIIALVFIPYIYLVMYILQRSSNFTYSFKGLAFSMSSFMIHIQALIAVLTGQKNGFSITSKTAVSGNFIHLNWMHLTYIGIGLLGISYYIYFAGITVSLFANVSWIFLNIIIMIPFIRSSLPLKQKSIVIANEESLEAIPVVSTLTIDK